MRMVPTKKSIITVSPHIARAQMTVCLLRLKKPAKALTLGRKAIAGIKKDLPGATAALAGAHYNVACAYALTGDEESALDHLSKAIIEDEKYATIAAKDSDFANLKNESGFKSLIKKR